MGRYAIYRKEISAIQMFWLIIKSWFTAPPLDLGLIIMPTYFIALILQILFFLPALPIIALVYVPMSLFLYSKPERSWGIWMVSFAVCASAISFLIFAATKSPSESLPIFGFFVLMSGLCGVFTYFNLYTTKHNLPKD
jgi:predicted CDP-diglyceride synthetase/phosphatidate cytidylyltransferase